ncbi:hypothetical protein NFI96_004024 [Prochilodus magdalenae]|nr:hypothetical protein NFI96_004024 [Prochilodus magdalenae]
MDPRALRTFYTCTVESILTGSITTWYGSCTAIERKALQRVVQTAQYITGVQLPNLLELYTSCCQRKTRKILKDSTHPSHCLFSQLPSGRRFRKCTILSGSGNQTRCQQSQETSGLFIEQARHVTQQQKRRRSWAKFRLDWTGVSLDERWGDTRLVNPQWGHEDNTVYRECITVLQQRLMTGFSVHMDVIKTAMCKQEDSESVHSYLTRLTEVHDSNSGLERPQALAGKAEQSQNGKRIFAAAS